MSWKKRTIRTTSSTERKSARSPNRSPTFRRRSAELSRRWSRPTRSAKPKPASRFRWSVRPEIGSSAARRRLPSEERPRLLRPAAAARRIPGPCAEPRGCRPGQALAFAYSRIEGARASSAEAAMRPARRSASVAAAEVLGRIPQTGNPPVAEIEPPNRRTPGLAAVYLGSPSHCECSRIRAKRRSRMEPK